MPIDKSWMQSGRSSEDYFAGVESFLNYAYNHVKPDDSKIFCPCSKCSNRYRHLRYEAHKHLLYNGIKLTYTTWYLHCEGEDEDSYEVMKVTVTMMDMMWPVWSKTMICMV